MDVKRKEDFVYFDDLFEPLQHLEKAFNAAGEDIQFEGMVHGITGAVMVVIYRGAVCAGEVEVNRIMPADVLKDVAAAVRGSGVRLAQEEEQWTA